MQRNITSTRQWRYFPLAAILLCHRWNCFLAQSGRHSSCLSIRGHRPSHGYTNVTARSASTAGQATDGCATVSRWKGMFPTAVLLSFWSTARMTPLSITITRLSSTQHLPPAMCHMSISVIPLVAMALVPTATKVQRVPHVATALYGMVTNTQLIALCQ